MAIQIQLRRDTRANWLSVNPILSEGEIGLELPTGLWKIGDGIRTYSALPYGQPLANIRIDIGDGTNDILNGTTGYSAPLPWSGEIIGWDIVENSPTPNDASISVEIWKDSSANYPPTSADKISASAPITLTNEKIASSMTLTGWTTAVVAGDCIGFQVASTSNTKRVQISLKVLRA